MQQGDVTKDNVGRIYLFVAINNPNGRKLRMLWDTAGAANISTDGANAMNIKIPATAQTTSQQGFLGASIQLKKFPVILYMPLGVAPLQKTITVGGSNDILDTATILTRFNMRVTSTGLQLIPRQRSSTATSNLGWDIDSI